MKYLVIEHDGNGGIDKSGVSVVEHDGDMEELYEEQIIAVIPLSWIGSEPDGGWTIVCAEDGDEFQHYVNKDGKPITIGEPIGIEKGDTIWLLDGVYFA